MSKANTVVCFKIEGESLCRMGLVKETDTFETIKERLSRVFNVNPLQITILEIS